MMDRQGRPPASDVEVWLARELAFLDGIERRIRRRAVWARRSLWMSVSVLAAAVGACIWIYALSV
jgi:anti-sigma-K factor RskA